MCNEYVVMNIDGVMKHVRLAIGGGGQVVGDVDPEDPELVHEGIAVKQYRWNGFPDREMPVALLGPRGGVKLEIMRWGFPAPKAGMPVVTNVRNLESRFWKPWLEPQWRCLVPVTEFCEWTDNPDPVTGKKSKRWFKLKDDTPFMFAGIWRTCEGVRGPKSKPVEGLHKVFSFITTEPNEIVGVIHAKAMPVILTRDKWKDWLYAPADIAKELIKPSPADEMAPPSDLTPP